MPEIDLAKVRQITAAYEDLIRLGCDPEIITWHAMLLRVTLAEIDRLVKKYETLPSVCNRGHRNNLPLALWDCPTCVEELRAKVESIKTEALAAAVAATESEHPGDDWPDGGHLVERLTKRLKAIAPPGAITAWLAEHDGTIAQQVLASRDLLWRKALKAPLEPSVWNPSPSIEEIVAEHDQKVYLRIIKEGPPPGLADAVAHSVQAIERRVKERCCKAMCDYCYEGSEVLPIESAATGLSYFHQVEHGNLVECRAAGIRRHFAQLADDSRPGL